MDLSRYDTKKAAAEGAFLHLEGPGGEKLIDEDTDEPIGFTCIGADSPKYQRLEHQQQTARLGRLKFKRGRVQGVDTEQTLEESIELAATAITAFHHINDDGSTQEYSHEAAVRILTKYPWVLEQVQEFVEERSNFLGN